MALPRWRPDVYSWNKRGSWPPSDVAHPLSDIPKRQSQPDAGRLSAWAILALIQTRLLFVPHSPNPFSHFPKLFQRDPHITEISTLKSLGTPAIADEDMLILHQSTVLNLMGIQPSAGPPHPYFSQSSTESRIWSKGQLLPPC